MAETKQELKEIFWKKGRFINKGGMKLTPKPIGIPLKVVYYHEKNRPQSLEERIDELVLRLPHEYEGHEEVNAFTISDESYHNLSEHYSRYIQFYKI